MAALNSRSCCQRCLATLFVLWSFPAFSQPARTPSDLIQQVFTGLELKDEAQLKSLAISKQDFKKFIWPSVRRTVVAKLGISAETLFALSASESEIGLASIVKEFGGRKFDVLQISSLTAERHPIRRRRFNAYSGPAVTIRDDNGNEHMVHVVGGIVEFGGVYKV
jgi:hypothetical protein